MIPASIISKLNEKEESINFGSVTLKIVKHDGHKSRYQWIEESSEVEDSPTSGECQQVITKDNTHFSQAEGKKHEKSEGK